MVCNKDALKDDEDAPLSMTPNISILDAFEDAFDEDDGFTTIKDLAERGITKMEPLDYDDFYLVNLLVFDSTQKIQTLFFSCVNFPKNGEKEKKAHEEIIWQPPMYALRLGLHMYIHHRSSFYTEF